MKDRYDIEAEKVCEYQISSNRKKLWVIELDLLEMLEDACNKLGISYFMIFGSAMGAVRHKGFIPWDDDIDLGMLREDFDTFVKRGKEFFPDYVDIQYGVSERGADILLRIRDGRYTGILGNERKLPGNKGIFIEIYVFDSVGTGKFAEFQMKASSAVCAAMFAKDKGFKGKLEKALQKIIGMRTLWDWYTKICTASNGKNKTFVNLVSTPKYGKQVHRFRIEKSELSKTISVPFEYTNARIPIGNDKYLTLLYKDYMTLPPVEKRGVVHDFIVFYDPNKPYTEYENGEILEQYFGGDASLSLI